MKFLDELKIIPGVAWLIDLLLAGGILLLMFVNLPQLPLGDAEILFIACILLCIFACVLLIGYINMDARRRSMNHVMWTLLSIFIPYGIGIMLYFVLRDPKMISCPRCSVPGRPGYAFCPQCGADMAPSCPACKRTIELGWNRCAHCGTELSPQ
jgi:hypothetical protein